MLKKPVFNRRIAQQLCRQGFKIIDVQPNNYKPWFNVYYFNKTEELDKAFDLILRNKNKSKG